MRRAILSATTVVEISAEQAREWFLSLEKHPERYQFDTHEGFEFAEGSFGEIGARFTTREKFLFLKLKLLFELTDVGASCFWFHLIRPRWLAVWGLFNIDDEGQGNTLLSLSIGSESRLGQLMLRSSPVATAVQGQIHREVEHVKRSMERLYT
jgi:hypothetical protein